MSITVLAQFHVDPSHSQVMREIGLDADSVFTDPRVKVWRSLADRENATLDHTRPDGSSVRLHIKRYPASAGSMARQELTGFYLLKDAHIPAACIIAHGSLPDGRSFIILEDLAGFTPADIWLAQGHSFDRLLEATADLAALLHHHQLHHRDLYLCHFMVKPVGNQVEAKLIDMARVAKLSSMLTRRRWIVKDVGQFWYSTQSLPVTEAQRLAWLERYCLQRKISARWLIGPVCRKASAIARHDARLKKTQPLRNVSIDTGTNRA
jgi:hypothetical protein